MKESKSERVRHSDNITKNIPEEFSKWGISYLAAKIPDAPLPVLAVVASKLLYGSTLRLLCNTLPPTRPCLVVAAEWRVPLRLSLVVDVLVFQCAGLVASGAPAVERSQERANTHRIHTSIPDKHRGTSSVPRVPCYAAVHCRPLPSAAVHSAWKKCNPLQSIASPIPVERNGNNFVMPGVLLYG